MHGIIFTPNKNSKRDKITGKLRPDYTGAFKPEAEAFADYHFISRDMIFAIDITKTKKEMRKEVCDLIEKHGRNSVSGLGLFTVAFFCHGWKTGIQLGFDVHTIKELALAMRNRVVANVVVPLYCCSTARDGDRDIADDTDPDAIGGDGGFADELRDHICSVTGSIYCRVIAHVTAGHTTLNPWVRYFEGEGSFEGGKGGFWVVRPRGPFWKKWIAWLRKKDPYNSRKHVGNQYLFPFCTTEEIRQGF